MQTSEEGKLAKRVTWLMNMEIVVDEREHARLAVEASGGQYLAKKEGTARHEAARAERWASPSFTSYSCSSYIPAHHRLLKDVNGSHRSPPS